MMQKRELWVVLMKKKCFKKTQAMGGRRGFVYVTKKK